MEIQISAGIEKCFRLALAKDYPCVGWLLGWHIDSGIICLGCAAGTGTTADNLVRDLPRVLELFPSGVEVVGVFACGTHPFTETGIVDFFEQLNVSGFQALNETNEFCFLTQGQAEPSCHGYLYNNTQRSLSLPTLKFVETAALSKDLVVCRVTGTLPLAYELNFPKEELEECLNVCFRKLSDVVSSSTATFHLLDSQVLLQGSPKFRTSAGGLQEDAPCSELSEHLDSEEVDGFISVGERKKTSQGILKWKMLFQASGDDAVKQTVSCLPIIHYELREFQVVSLDIPVDLLVMVPKTLTVGELPDVFSRGVCHQLRAIQHCILEHNKNDCAQPVEIFHFRPPVCEHFITVPYPKGVTEGDLETFRRRLHEQLLLPEDRPLLRRTNRYQFPEDVAQDAHLINPHTGLPSSIKENEEVNLVDGTYAYHHYMQDHIDDNGWGCAYRSLQTIVSWFRHQGYTTRGVPSHAEIQQALVDVGDKPAKFVGSKQWIGSMEVSYCLQQLIGVTSKIMNVSSGAEIASKARELGLHFKNQGTPIMIGGGVLAHTILGIKFNTATGETKFLILDPHYTGQDILNVVCNKGWCGWKGVNFWDERSYYNLCLPQRPLDI